jgi:hypothetical protein
VENDIYAVVVYVHNLEINILKTQNNCQPNQDRLIKRPKRSMCNLFKASKNFHKSLNNVKVVANHLTTYRATSTLIVVTVAHLKKIVMKKAK